VRVLDQGSQTLQVVEVKSQGLIIGRQLGNDLVLPDQAISHRHLQVMWDGKQLTVKDLGSRNGTLLEGVLLLPQESQPWMERQLIRVGPFWLRLEGPSPAGTQTVQRPLPGTATFGTTGAPGTQTSATMVRSGRIGMAVNPRMLTITTGQPSTTQVTLTNLGSIVDWFTTIVEGVPPEWLKGAGQEVQLNPGMQETIELNVNVARSSNNFAQEYPVTIRARSREQPNESGTVQARWNVLPFKEDALRLEPRRASGRGGASYTVTLVEVGTIGNIDTGFFCSPVCGASPGGLYRIVNSSPFSGGRDPQTYTAVQQSDIDGAANPLIAALTANAQKSIKARPNERLISSPQCKSTVAPDHESGDQAKTVTVTCIGEAYDHDGVLAMATQWLKQDAFQSPGPSYALAGNVVTTQTRAQVTDANQGTLSVSVIAEGVWVFQFNNAQKQALAKLIAGKKRETAQSLLLQHGVERADVQLSGGNGVTLPSDPTQIKFVILDVKGK